jgi:hypothetical protein
MLHKIILSLSPVNVLVFPGKELLLLLKRTGCIVSIVDRLTDVGTIPSINSKITYLSRGA